MVFEICWFRVSPKRHRRHGTDGTDRTALTVYGRHGRNGRHGRHGTDSTDGTDGRHAQNRRHGRHGTECMYDLARQGRTAQHGRHGMARTAWPGRHGRHGTEGMQHANVGKLMMTRFTDHRWLHTASPLVTRLTVHRPVTAGFETTGRGGRLCDNSRASGSMFVWHCHGHLR